jgi:ERCC4-type nuclease
MILIDSKAGDTRMRNYQNEWLVHIQKLGIKAQMADLQFGDACFEGRGPEGSVMIGIERKSLSDFLNCIDDSRYSAFQKPGLSAMYQKNALIIEGVWKPDPASGYLLECVAALTWRPYKYRMQMVRYSKLFRYLLSVQMTGTLVIQTRNIEETAYDTVEMYHYFQKKWEDHTSMLEVQKLNIPDLRVQPSLVRKWAADLPGIGVKHSMDAEKIFKTPIDLAQADESDWLRISGVGVKLARSIVGAIRGW